MRQPAPGVGREAVFPTALLELSEFVREYRADLAFALPETERRLRGRIAEGLEKYGRLLETHNGRDALRDAWEEAADLLFYTQQALMERVAPQTTALFAVADIAREALLLLTEERGQRGDGG